MDGNIMVAGAPRFGNGIVQAFSRSASTGTWSTLNTVFPGQEVDDFGAAVDVSVGSSRVAMAVGAPRSLDTQGFQIPFGAAFYYELNGDAWSQRGGRVAPNPTPLTANGEAGAAVAVAADSRRIAVGGPSISLNSQNIDNGQVFTYQFDGSSLNLLFTLDGPLPRDRFGAALAMTSDGNRLLVGAPGATGAGTGAIYYYEWTGTQWDLILPLPGTTDTENFGTTVAILTDDGETIAFGAPNFGGNRGAIRVYRRLAGSFFQKVGGDIEGNPGDFLGSTLTGSSGGILAGTANGSFRAYEFDTRRNEWATVGSADPSLGSRVVGITSNVNGDIGIGIDESVVVYGF